MPWLSTVPEGNAMVWVSDVDSDTSSVEPGPGTLLIPTPTLPLAPCPAFALFPMLVNPRFTGSRSGTAVVFIPLDSSVPLNRIAPLG